MLGRQVRSALLQLPINARRLVLRTAPSQCYAPIDLLPFRALILPTQRFYATPGRPRKAVGEPSKPVKRAVKRAAKSTSGGEAAKQIQAKKTAARAKKPAAKKANTTATASGRGRQTSKKELTPEQQVVKEAKVARAKLADLKKAALSPPNDGSYMNAHVFFLKEKMGGQKIGGQGRLAELSKSAHEEWRDLLPADLEHYNHLAQQEKQSLQAAYKSWVESHTPDQIRFANNARRQLKRKVPNSKGKKRYLPIKDERAVKRPLSSYLQFSLNRHASGDFKNIKVSERAKLIGQEWKALSEGEKKKYKDLQSEDSSRYTSEYNDAFGHMPPMQQAATAAA